MILCFAESPEDAKTARGQALVQGSESDMTPVTPGSDRLISVAADNSIKVWDLQLVLTPQSKAKVIDMGATTALTYNK